MSLYLNLLHALIVLNNDKIKDVSNKINDAEAIKGGSLFYDKNLHKKLNNKAMLGNNYINH